MTMEPVRPSVQSHPSLVHSAAAGAKPRKTNFTAREVDVLLSSVRRRREAVLFGVAGGRGWAKAWHEVAAAVSSVEGILRSEGDVRKKWTYLKWEAKNTSKPGRDPTSRAVLDILTGGHGGGSGSSSSVSDHHHHHHHVSHTHHLQQQQHQVSSGHHLQQAPQQQQKQQHQQPQQQHHHHMPSRQSTVPSPSSSSQPGSRNLLDELLVPQPPPAQKPLQPPQPQAQKILPPQQVSAPKPIAPKPPPVTQSVSPIQPLPPPPEVCLRWNSYHSNMQATFPSLLNNEQFVDVTLACEGRSIKCHKMMLSACSAYFEELLSQNPCQHPIVLMKDLRYWEVQALVDFMYRGEVNVGQDKLPSLLAAAEALQIKGLAGPAFSSNDEDNSQPTPVSASEDYLDESTPSPSSARRARKRRVMSSTVTPRVQSSQSQQVPSSPKSTSVSGKRLVKPVSIPSTSSNYDLESPSVSTEPPSRRARKSDADLVGEIKIEPIDIEISNDSMDQMDDSFLDKPYDDADLGEDSNCLSNDPGGTNDSKNLDLGDTMKSLHGHETDNLDYGTNNSTSGSENFKYEDSGSQDAGLASISDIPGTSYQDGLIQPSSSGMRNSNSNVNDSLLGGHM